MSSKIPQIKFDPFPTTVLPFEYDPVEWKKSPKSYMDDYLRNFGSPLCRIENSEDDEKGYFSSLEICGHEFTTSTTFRTVERSEQNVIILALLNMIRYCETAKELQNIIASRMGNQKVSKKLSKSHDSIVKDKSLNNVNQQRSDELSFLPQLDRLSIYHDRHAQDTNLLMDNFEIDGVIFEANKEKVTVCILDKSVIQTLYKKQAIKLGSNCYEIPYKFYEKKMGRACWVFNVGISTDPVYIHPCKIITNENSIHMESQNIPEDKSLKDYHNVYYHFVVLFPSRNGFYGVYKMNY